MTKGKILTTGTTTVVPVDVTEGYLRAAAELAAIPVVSAVAPVVFGTATDDPSAVYVVATSIATQVGLYYDPLLIERNEQTAWLNRTVQYGYAPPKSSTVAPTAAEVKAETVQYESAPPHAVNAG